MILGFKITFDRPLYLLLLILFLAFTIIPYFTLSKKYRKTRNRLTSMALHALVSILVISILAGISFVRILSNPKNEVIILVDSSNTTEVCQNEKDEFVKKVINQCKFADIKVGIVTFGFDQEYAVPLTRDYNGIYEKYKNADLPDTSATNIASALNYAKDLFTSDEARKIVLVTDGKETDENAKSVIKSVAASGITVDTAYIPSSYLEKSDFEIVSINLPDYHVNKDEECIITVDIFSNYQENVSFSLYDNDVSDEGSINIDLVEGLQSIEFIHSFSSDGLHKLSVKAENIQDEIEENNDYTSFFYLEVYNKILIIEQEEGSSESLYKLMTDNKDYVVDVINTKKEDLPDRVEQLCNYDEVIMNNIANSDLSDEFVDILNDYVNNYGGGLFTTGGIDSYGDAHAYNRNDMIGTLYQQMLPVQAINYTPPVGVIVIIDRSGSMSTADEFGNTLLEWAKAGATSCLNALTERDYFGIMTLESDYNTILELTPRTQEAKILAAINSIDGAMGGTVFPGAIDRAGQALRALKQVDKKHIIVVTDGQVPESEVSQYEEYAKNYYETDGITISVIGVSMNKPVRAEELMSDAYDYDDLDTQTPFSKMLRLTKISHGKLHIVDKSDSSTLVSQMREDLNAPQIKETNFEPFYPHINKISSSVYNNVDLLTDEEHANCLDVLLDGFNGVKVRGSADLHLVGDYNVPIFASWKYGEGTVGSLMVDVNGLWSTNLLESENGKTLLFNMINSITPTKNIRSNDIKLSLYEDNYSNTLSVFTELKENEKIIGTINYSDKSGDYSVSLNDLIEKESRELRLSSCYLKSNLSIENSYSRCSFIIRTPGVYTINVKKIDQNGNVIGENSLTKSFAYSLEYELLYDEEEINYSDKLQSLSASSNGKLISDNEDPHEVVDSFDTSVTKSFDPRYIFAILAMICFLLDIAVRKFKFKWLHEIIKNKKLAKK